MSKKIKYGVLSVTSHSTLLKKRCPSHDMCFYQVMMTLHFLNDETKIENLRKPICDIVFCVSAFLFVEFSVLCTLLHNLNGAIHEVEPRGKKDESKSILMHPS